MATENYVNVAKYLAEFEAAKKEGGVWWKDLMHPHLETLKAPKKPNDKQNGSWITFSYTGKYGHQHKKFTALMSGETVKFTSHSENSKYGYKPMVKLDGTNSAACQLVTMVQEEIAFPTIRALVYLGQALKVMMNKKPSELPEHTDFNDVLLKEASAVTDNLIGENDDILTDSNNPAIMEHILTSPKYPIKFMIDQNKLCLLFFYQLLNFLCLTKTNIIFGLRCSARAKHASQHFSLRRNRQFLKFSQCRSGINPRKR